MFRTTIKDLTARKLRLLTTSLAVLLGVAFMAGTLVLTDTIGRTFDTLFADVNAGTDAHIRGEAAFSDSQLGQQRPRLDVGLVDEVARVDGVAVAEAHIEAYAQLVDRSGTPMGDPVMGAPTYGGIWLETDELNGFDLAAGRAPAADAEVVIDRSSARSGGFGLGDEVTVLTQSGPQVAHVVGIATFGGADSPGGASIALFTAETAQSWLTAPGKIDAVKVVAEPGVSSEELVERIGTVVPASAEVLTGAQITAEDQNEIRDGLSFFNTFLLTFALIALFVGSFIIYNSFSILVAQRNKEMALLRAVGASKRQILGSVLTEATVVGAIASVAGLAAGVGVASGLKSLLVAMGIDIPAGAVVISTRTVVVSMIAGIGVSVASAVLPARRAARVAPVAAMRGTTDETSTRRRRRVVIGGVIAGMGSASMAGGLFGDAGFTAVGLGAALVFIGVAVLGPVLARPISRVLGSPLPRLKGMAGMLARENAMRNPKRTSATAAALMIGVALVGLITILATSTKASIDNAIDAAFTGDLVVDSGSFGFGGLDPSLANELNALPEVDAATGVRVTAAEIDGETTMVLGTDPTAVGKIFDLGDITGSLQDLGATEIAMSADAAGAAGLELGDRIPVRFAETGNQELSLAATYTEVDLAGDHLVGLAAFEANVADQFDFQVFITLADGADPSGALAAVQAVASAYPQADVQDLATYKQGQSAMIDQLLNLVYALLALAVFIALLGIANTLALSIFERTRELGLLRAVGMTRRQLRATVRYESVIIALLGTTMGLAIGVGFGWAIVRALESEGLTTFVVPTGQLAVVAIVAAIAGVVAAILPARRAARLDVLDAIVTT